jgi:peptidoglycan/xylan/chitin deacetylase (PgdA/CDA1 family)
VVAAPIIEKFAARACFFITTECMGSDRVPPWDHQEGIVSEWMTWDQVRSLGRSGHEVGAHTMTHVDLGLVRGEAARAEIEGARRRIESELGERPAFFAYPFGRREQIVDENIELVKALGLPAVCLPTEG